MVLVEVYVGCVGRSGLGLKLGLFTETENGSENRSGEAANAFIERGSLLVETLAGSGNTVFCTFKLYLKIAEVTGSLELRVLLY